MASAADLPVKAPSIFAPSWAVNPFAGVTVVPDAWYAEAGAVFALNRNLQTDGWLFRVKGGGGEYDYNITSILVQRASFETVDLMFGYQKFIGTIRWTGYLGLNVEHHDNSDPAATVKGTEAGVKILGELYAPIYQRAYLLLIGSYSSAFNNYYTMAKVGLRVTPTIAIGPQIEALGNDRFSAVRTGPFVAFDVGSASQIILSGGYTWDTKKDAFNDHSGGFGTIHIRTHL